MTRVVKVDPRTPPSGALEEAAALLRDGGIVAFPTETVYGLGANALDPTAVQKIFAAKGRPATNPLIVHVADLEQARELVAEWPSLAEQLAEAFWPGPLTMVLPRGDAIDDVVTAGLDTVGVRMPSHPVARRLIELAGVPIAAPSANPYTGVSATRAEHVREGLGDAVDMIVDGGATSVGLESTVVRVESDGVTVLRPGMITTERLRAALDAPVRVEQRAVSDSEVRSSPGQSERHYSPRARVITGPADELVAHAESSAMALVFADGAEAFEGFGRVEALSAEPREWAHRLYDLFWEGDRDGFETIVVEEPPDEPSWEAIRDRLGRARYTG